MPLAPAPCSAAVWFLRRRGTPCRNAGTRRVQRRMVSSRGRPLSESTGRAAGRALSYTSASPSSSLRSARSHGWVRAQVHLRCALAACLHSVRAALAPVAPPRTCGFEDVRPCVWAAHSDRPWLASPGRLSSSAPGNAELAAVISRCRTPCPAYSLQTLHVCGAPLPCQSEGGSLRGTGK